MNLINKCSQSRCKRKKGFALILTLALISFVFLLVITLVNQVRMEFSFTDSRQNQVLAKAHARMGMMIAIGEIQKHLGPDMRISTTADIYDERLESAVRYKSTNYPSPTILEDAVDLNENNDVDTVPFGQRMWTGVWKNRGGNSETELAYRPLPDNGDAGVGFPKSWDTDDGWDRHPAIEVAWLVSGNEGWSSKLGIFTGGSFVDEFIEVPDGVIIDDDGERTLNKALSGVYGNAPNAWADHNVVVTGKLNGYFHPLVDISKPSEDEDDIESTLILHAPVTKADGQYAAEPVRVPNTTVFSGTGDKTGKYAYWVGDEGVKSKFNIQEPIGLSDETKLKVASRPNFEVSGGFDDGGGSPKLINLGSHAKLSTSIVDNVNARNDLISTNYHNFTVDSFGVLSDLRTGGLKRDLSLAFAKDENSKLWDRDFNDNFIFRDRVHCLKSLPIYSEQSQRVFGKGLHRNHWFDQGAGTPRGPLVDDKDVLLAGPPWSVLAEYHKLYEKYQEAWGGTENEHFKKHESEVVLEVVAPDEFPRVVGDNALIFDRRGIKGSQEMTNEQARPFFNIFGGPKRVTRPEPKNHSIFPIITKIGVSVFPAIGTNKLSLAISPKVSLWNPYDIPMKLDGLFIDVPFRSASFNAQNFNLKEYDLYRKWWIRLYNNVESFPPQDVGTKNTKKTKAYSKNPQSPWGLFRRIVDSDVTTIENTSSLVYLKEPGIIDASKFGGGYAVAGSKQSLNLATLANGTKVLTHENFRENVTYDGVFHFFSFSDDFKVEINIPRIYLSLEEEILEPGEAASFTIEEVQTEQIPDDPNDDPPLIRLRKGDMEDFFLWESSFAYSSQQLQSDYIVSYYLNFSGLKGFDSNTIEQIDKTSSGFRYRELGTGFTRFDSLAMYYSEVNPTRFDPSDADPLVRYTLNFGASEIFTENAAKIYANAHITEKYLRDTYTDTIERNSSTPGVGWEWRAQMPGDEKNERILLNDFNLRAMVHSSQHGRGNWMSNWQDFTPGFLGGGGAGEGDLQRNVSFSGVEVWQRTDEDGNILQFDLSDEVTLSSVSQNLEKPKFMKNDPSTKEFPWLYDLDDGWSPTSYDINAERSFNDYPANVASYDPDSRTNWLGLTPTGANPAEIVENNNSNILLDDSAVPREFIADERIGFFTHESHLTSKRSRNEISGNINSSSRAILFEIPKSPPLSILQYRHANLNNYLHGPSYALGNSYATTQVARHRPWGRVDTREEKIVKDDPDVPEAEVWTASVQTPSDMIKLQQELHDSFEKKYGSDYEASGLKKTQEIVEDWNNNNVDFSDRDSRFAPWRGFSSSSLNHQNTTLDHSFYLNRALVDGYFLSGSTAPDDLSNEDNVSLGRRFRPMKEHHRLIAYLRKGDRWTDGRTSYSALREDGSTDKSEDNEFRYQTLAGDLFVDGAFNINSTSLDAWVTQLASLRGHPVSNAGLSLKKTPIVRFLSEPEISNNWNELRTLSDEEIIVLAKEMVRQVKLRGPFLDFADFVNRRLNPSPMDTDPSVTKGSRPIFLQKKMSQWSNYPEDRESVKGLRGAVQAAIASAGLNDLTGYVTNETHTAIIPTSSWTGSTLIPEWPEKRWQRAASPGSGKVGSYIHSKFGFHAVSLDQTLFQWWNHQDKKVQGLNQNFGAGMEYQGNKIIQVLDSPSFGTAKLFDSTVKYNSTKYGEAPENLLAVEHVATGANKPGWVMQGDLLSPLAPVTSARSDTFTIRVMGEHDGQTASKSWIELVVQRTPDYVKPDLDGPHHRPHEPFKDLNLNGYWDDNENIGEQWIDLNRNGDVVKSPDLPGVGEYGRETDYRDGMLSDLKLNIDKQEEGEFAKGKISHKGINQRFGRKFKIIRFRWLRENEV